MATGTVAAGAVAEGGGPPGPDGPGGGPRFPEDPELLSLCLSVDSSKMSLSLEDPLLLLDRTVVGPCDQGGTPWGPTGLEVAAGTFSPALVVGTTGAEAGVGSGSNT